MPSRKASPLPPMVVLWGLGAVGSIAGRWLSRQVTSPSLVHWLPMVGLGVGLGAGTLVFKYLAAPLLVWRKSRFPIASAWRVRDPARDPLSPVARAWVDAQKTTLVTLGFEPVAELTATVAFAALLYHRERRTVGQVTWGPPAQTVAFRTTLDGDRERMTVARCGKSTSTGDPPWMVVERLQDVDAAVAWAAHAALSARDPGASESTYRPDPPLPVADPEAYMRANEERIRAWNQARGDFYTDEGRGVVAITLRAAFQRTWMLIPMHQRRWQRKARERTARRLRELGLPVPSWPDT